MKTSFTTHWTKKRDRRIGRTLSRDPKVDAFVLNQRQTAEKLNLTKQGVTVIENRVALKLRSALKKLHVSGDFDRDEPGAGKMFMDALSEAFFTPKSEKHVYLIKPL